jgi:hypothetical protein
VRVLGAAVREAAPEGVSGAVSAAAAGVLGPLGPIGVGLAAAAAKTAKSLAESAVGKKEDEAPGKPDDAGDSRQREATRLDLIAIAGEDLHAFVDGLADSLGVAGSLRPAGVRIRSHQIKVDSDEETKADPFLNSFLADDLQRVTQALRDGDAGRALTSYLGIRASRLAGVAQLSRPRRSQAVPALAIGLTPHATARSTAGTCEVQASSTRVGLADPT